MEFTVKIEDFEKKQIITDAVDKAINEKIYPEILEYVKKAVIEARLDEHTPECAWCESGNKCNRGQELERQLFELERGRNDNKISG